MPKLIVLTGPDAGAAFELTLSRMTVGRHSANGVALQDQRVSRKHCELRANLSGGYQLFDLQSGNGTQVNGRHVQVIDLRPGDQIAIGDTVLMYTANVSGAGESVSLGPIPPDATRLVVPEGSESMSEIVRTIGRDAGSQILKNPELAPNDWLRGKLASLAVMYEASTAVSRITDVDALLARLLELVLRTTEADHGCAMIWDSESESLLPKAVKSRVSQGGEFVVSRTIAEHVYKTGEGILVADAADDQRFRGGESIVRHGIREVICVPLRGRHDTVGVLFLDTEGAGTSSQKRFTEDHLTLAVAIAHQAAIALEETMHYQALVQAEKLAAVGQTIAAMSHHIKNIMQGVRFGSDMVRIGLDGNEREMLVKGWRLVEKNQAKIDDLILDMLNYSKPREPLWEATDLLSLAGDVIDIVRGRAGQMGITIDWHPVALPPVSCDPDGIHRALLNILSNAVDALSETDNPRIVVTTKLLQDAVEIVVQDNGPGIAPEKIADLFKPFVSTKGSRGTGLGLPVSRKIMQEHGGDVLVESEPDHGATFTLHLPITPSGKSA
jgi:signal transduction histidine kinase